MMDPETGYHDGFDDPTADACDCLGEYVCPPCRAYRKRIYARIVAQLAAERKPMAQAETIQSDKEAA